MGRDSMCGAGLLAGAGFSKPVDQGLPDVGILGFAAAADMVLHRVAGDKPDFVGPVP